MCARVRIDAHCSFAEMVSLHQYRNLLMSTDTSPAQSLSTKQSISSLQFSLFCTLDGYFLLYRMMLLTGSGTRAQIRTILNCALFARHPSLAPLIIGVPAPFANSQLHSFSKMSACLGLLSSLTPFFVWLNLLLNTIQKPFR